MGADKLKKTYIKLLRKVDIFQVYQYDMRSETKFLLPVQIITLVIGKDIYEKNLSLFLYTHLHIYYSAFLFFLLTILRVIEDLNLV